MIQTQTFSLDNLTRMRLLELSNLIAQYKDDPEKVGKLIAEHDELTKQAQTKLYDPRAEARWA